VPPGVGLIGSAIKGMVRRVRLIRGATFVSFTVFADAQVALVLRQRVLSIFGYP